MENKKSRLQLQIVSDLHLEFRETAQIADLITPCAPILILAGDICPMTNEEDIKKLMILLTWASNHYNKIIHVPGNHEYYCPVIPFPINRIQSIVAKLSTKFPKYKFLNNKYIEFPPYLIYGTTLWSNIPKNLYSAIKGEVNDYNQIYVTVDRNLSPDIVTKIHNKSVTSLMKTIDHAKKNNLKMIVITHHKPYISSAMTEARNYAYESDLMHLIKSPIKLWAYGHTHVHDNKLINGVRIYSNPKGYPHQRTLFVKSEVLVV